MIKGEAMVLVTGAPGWLGTRLVELLRERKIETRCIVMPGADDSVLKKLGAEVVRADISGRDSLRGSCDGIKTVIHCAGVIHPKSVKEFYKVNVDGTRNILEEAIKSKAERFIYISSNSVAGLNIPREKLMEETDPPRPYMNYGRSKLKAEELVNAAFREGKIKTTILRPCWFYGIRQPERQTRFFLMIKKGTPLIFGDGKNLRSMSYIDNVIDAILLAEQKEVSIGKTYWIADKRPYQTIEIYQTIAKLLGVKDFRPRFVPNIVSTGCEMADKILQGMGLYIKEIHVAGEMDKDIACSIDKARKELGYEPRVDLEEGMARSIVWCRENGIAL